MFFSLVFLAGVFVAAFMQVLLKRSAMLQHKNTLREYLNFRVIISYSVLLLICLVSVYCYRFIPLTTGLMLSSAEYLFIAVLSAIFFKEHISRQKLIGLALIISGIALYSIK